MRNTNKICLSMLLLSSVLTSCGKSKDTTDAQPSATVTVETEDVVKTSCKADFTLKYGADIGIVPGNQLVEDIERYGGHL